MAASDTLNEQLVHDEHEQLVPTIPPPHDLEAPLRLTKSGPEPEQNCSKGDIALLTVYLVLCTIAFIMTFLPVGSVQLRIHPGDTISAGLVLDGLLANQTEPTLDSCDHPYNAMCSGVSEDGVLQKHQSRLLQKVGESLKNQSGLAGTLYAACTVAAQESTPLNTTCFDRWARGKSWGGLTIESGTNPFLASNEKHLFVSTALARMGPKALGPYDELRPSACPEGFELLSLFARVEPVVAPFMLKTVYSDNATAACAALQTLNASAPIYETVGPGSPLACAHIVGELFPNELAPFFNGTNAQYAHLYRTFASVVETLLTVFAGNERAEAKLKAIKLFKWPTSYVSPSLPAIDQPLNWVQWSFQQQKAQWRAEMAAPTEKMPIMMPWEVNAFFMPSANRVYVPPGLLSICPDGASPAFWAGTVAFVLAHEISHSLDPMGIHFDHVGTYSPITSYQLPNGYAKAARCLERNAVKRGIHPNQTLGESFADALGWFASSRAIAKGPEWPIKALGLPSAEFAAVAMLARTWCTNPTNLQQSRYNYSLWHDEHPPARFRVDNTLAVNAPRAKCAPDYLEPCMSFIADVLP